MGEKRGRERGSRLGSQRLGRLVLSDSAEARGCGGESNASITPREASGCSREEAVVEKRPTHDLRARHRVGVTREALIEEVRRVAAKVGRSPTQREFFRWTKTPASVVVRLFGGWGELVRAAGLFVQRSGVYRTDAWLLSEWARVARKVGCVPRRAQSQAEGEVDAATLCRRLGGWNAVAGRFLTWAGADGQRGGGWRDVVRMVRAAGGGDGAPRGPGARCGRTRQPSVGESDAASLEKGEEPRHGVPSHLRAALEGERVWRRVEGRPLVGEPLRLRGLAYAPDSEQGVVLLFGMLAEELGFHIEKVRKGFPDCEAVRRVGERAWQRVRIEFEFESWNFALHGHDASGCDVIVCWRHTWAECPKGIDVVELARLVSA